MLANLDQSGRTIGAVEVPAGTRALALWPDDGTLVVGGAGPALVAYRIEKDGSLSAPENYCALRVRPGSPGGAFDLTVDRAGRLYAATREGAQILGPTGRLCGVLLKPERTAVTALAFGGPDFDRRYVVCGGKLYVRKMKARGVPPPFVEKRKK